MTSSEIIDKLLEMNDKNAISDLRILFQTADLVKFAKHNPLMNENDANLINAIDFINETKEKEDENAASRSLLKLLSLKNVPCVPRYCLVQVSLL